MERDGYTMTEAEWVTSDDHSRMTFFVAKQTSVRKLRLAEVALCRSVEHHLVDAHSCHVLSVCEAHADGFASDGQLAEVRSRAVSVYEGDLPRTSSRRDAYQLVHAADTEQRLRLQIDMIDLVLFAERPHQLISPELQAACIAEAEIIRDVFGNPFRPVAFDPSWRTETVISLACCIYAERAFDRLPILADALEEAGCNHADVLSHCRSPGPHARGCWVVDGVLGKE